MGSSIAFSDISRILTAVLSPLRLSCAMVTVSEIVDKSSGTLIEESGKVMVESCILGEFCGKFSGVDNIPLLKIKTFRTKRRSDIIIIFLYKRV